MVRYALLGLLREQPDYGYRLKRRFDERVGPLWQLNIGQVYQTLRALQHAGLVSEVSDGAAGVEPSPARRMFELTPKGARVLARWLLRPPGRPRPVRDETLIRLLLLDDPERHSEALSRLAEQQDRHRHDLRRLRAQRGTPSRDGDMTLRELGLEAAVLHAEAHLRWLERCNAWLAARLDERVRASATA